MSILSKTRIEYEDEHLLVVYKPAGMLSQNDSTGDASVVDFVKRHLGVQQSFLIHRIDRPVGGLLAIAKNKRSAELFSRLLRKGRIRKKYTAIVFGTPPKEKDEIQNFVLEKEGHSTQVFDTVPVGQDNKKYKEAVLRYELVKSARFHDIKEFSEVFSLLSIELITGRKHQIRAQLSHMGNPIVGDSRYFNVNETVKNKMLKSSFLPKGEIALTANYISFPHPLKNGTIVEVKTSLPDYWVKFV